MDLGSSLLWLGWFSNRSLRQPAESAAGLHGPTQKALRPHPLSTWPEQGRRRPRASFATISGCGDAACLTGTECDQCWLGSLSPGPGVLAAAALRCGKVRRPESCRTGRLLPPGDGLGGFGVGGAEGIGKPKPEYVFPRGRRRVGGRRSRGRLRKGNGSFISGVPRAPEQTIRRPDGGAGGRSSYSRRRTESPNDGSS